MLRRVRLAAVDQQRMPRLRRRRNTTAHTLHQHDTLHPPSTLEAASCFNALLECACTTRQRGAQGLQKDQTCHTSNVELSDRDEPLLAAGRDELVHDAARRVAKVVPARHGERSARNGESARRERAVVVESAAESRLDRLGDPPSHERKRDETSQAI
eukprot:6191419-Pleurochrysis_carterae.AAC.1